MQTIQIIKSNSNINENNKEDNNLNLNDIDETLNEIHNCLVIAFNNQFEDALKITESKSSTSIYHSVGKTFLLFLKAVLTLEKKQIDCALRSTNQLYLLCSNYQYKSSQSSLNYITNFFWSSSQQHEYTDIEAHAELCSAESLLMYALLTFLENQNLINLFKATLRFKSCYSSYKQCLNILKTKQNWTSELSKQNFQTGVQMGLGTFHLFISHLPNKIIKILNYIGFNSSTRSIGLNYLNESIKQPNSLRSPISVLINATYHCYIEHYFGLGNSNVDYIDQLLTKYTLQFPHSAFFLLFNGRINLLKGNLTSAIQHFNKCIEIQQDWQQLHNICYWELVWCYSIQCDWINALKYSNILRSQCAWSPAIYTYLSAIFLDQIYDEHFLSGFSKKKSNLYLNLNLNKNEIQHEIISLYQEVPKLRIRFAGKTIPAEKFAITNAEKFFNQKLSESSNFSSPLILPAIEYIYIWNIFAILEKNSILVHPIFERIDFKLSILQQQTNESNNKDNLCIVLLLKGVALRTIQLPNEALDCFQQILTLQNQLSQDYNFLPPFTAQELALTYIHLNDYQLANFWYEKAKKDYSNYLLETLLHFRIHCGQRLIQQLNSSNNSTVNLNLNLTLDSTLNSSLSYRNNTTKLNTNLNTDLIQNEFKKNELNVLQNKI